MFCSNCGQELPVGAVYCPRCGKQTRVYVGGNTQIGNPTATCGFVFALLSWVFLFTCYYINDGLVVVIMAILWLIDTLIAFITSIAGWSQGIQNRSGIGLGIAGFVISGIMITVICIALMVVLVGL